MTWSCTVCTLKNVNDTFLACEACGSERKTAIGEFETLSDGRSASPDPEPQKATIAAPAPRRPTRAAPKLAPPPSPIAESAVSSKKDKKNVDQLKPIYQELVDTERIYVNELQAVVNVFLMPLMAWAQEKSETAFLNLTEVNSIFGNLGEIAKVNLELLHEFDKALQAIPEMDAEGRVEGICRSFLMYASHLKMYAVYAIQFDEAQSRLKRVEERDKFVDFISGAAGMNEVIANQPLSSFLIKPIQRICKYPLFFHQMIKLVQEGSPAHTILKRALDAASDVASKINADKLRAEQNLRGFEVAKRLEHLTDVVLEPGRRYVGEWKCFLSEGNNSLSMKRRSLTNKMIHTEKKARTCFLFNDVLVIAKEVGTGHKLRYELRLWISMNQLQFGGTSNMSRIRDETSSATQQTETPSAAGNGEDKQDRSFKSKLFQLPLELIHVASTDRERCQIYRERQHQAQTSQIGQIAARRPSFLKKKDKNYHASSSSHYHNNNHQSTDTIITAYTMWFRSGAERARVGNLVENTLQDFEDKANSREATKKRPTLDALPPTSPTRRGEDSTRSLTSLNGGSGRAHFASSEDSGAEESGYPIRRVQSLDSGMDQNGAADLVSPFAAAKKSGVFSSDPSNTSAGHSLDSSLFPKKTDQSNGQGHTSLANGAQQSEGDLQKPQLTRRRSSNRPRPPPPPPPSVILVVPPGSQQRQQQQQSQMNKSIPLKHATNKSVTINNVATVSMSESDLDILQSLSLKSTKLEKTSVSVIGKDSKSHHQPPPEDLLISKWFGE